MISKYKVIDSISGLKPGSILTFDNGMYVYSNEYTSKKGNYYSSFKTALSPLLVENYAKAGKLIAEELPTSTNESTESAAVAKLQALTTLIAQLKNTYTQRNEAMQKKFEEGKVQPCVKVEHDTVHLNLMKLLNQFESIINE